MSFWNSQGIKSKNYYFHSEIISSGEYLQYKNPGIALSTKCLSYQIICSFCFKKWYVNSGTDSGNHR